MTAGRQRPKYDGHEKIRAVIVNAKELGKY